MSFVSTKEILKYCHDAKSGVGAFNINGLDEPRAIIMTAQRLGVPAIITVPGFAEKYVDFNDVVAVTCRASQEVDVPIAVHLSHAIDLSQIERACRAGFSSVMFDGSTLPYDENVAQTIEAVRLVNGRCDVEGELGAIASSWASVEKSLTDPGMAADFIQKTGIDILAVSVGNSHGLYKGTPQISFDTICSIEAKATPLNCYLTLHGGSGIPDADMKRAIACGITKICVYTEMCIEAKKSVVEYIKQKPNYMGNDDLPDLFRAAITSMAQVAGRYMEVFK